MPSPDGRLMHAEIQISDSIIMLSSEFLEMGGTCKSPKTAGFAASSLMILSRGYRRLVQTRPQRRGNRNHGAPRYVLGGSICKGARSVRSRVAIRHTHRRRVPGGNE